MVAKESLRKIARMEQFIQTKKERLAVLKDMSSSISSPRFDDMPRNPNKGKSGLEETILKYIDLENEIKADEEKLEHEKLIILEAIGKIEEPESPFINIGINYMNQAVRLWNEIFQIVKENCSTDYDDAAPQNDLMERLLRAREGR